MTTRAVSLLAATAAALLLACGSQPTTYLVALDQSGLASLPASCYSTPPTTPPQIQQWVQHELTIWEGAQNHKFLEISATDAIRVQFPSSGFSVSGLIEGGPKSWVYNATADRANNTTETRKLEFNFTDLSSTMVGTIAVTSTFSCATPPCGFQECSVTLNLNGRQIDAQYTGQL